MPVPKPPAFTSGWHASTKRYLLRPAAFKPTQHLLVACNMVWPSMPCRLSRSSWLAKQAHNDTGVTHENQPAGRVCRYSPRDISKSHACERRLQGLCLASRGPLWVESASGALGTARLDHVPRLCRHAARAVTSYRLGPMHAIG